MPPANLSQAQQRAPGKILRVVERDLESIDEAIQPPRVRRFGAALKIKRKLRKAGKPEGRRPPFDGMRFEPDRRSICVSQCNDTESPRRIGEKQPQDLG